MVRPNRRSRTVPDSKAYIVINNVSKHFGSVKAVDQVSINIAGGEFFSLLGASGCGKTTLLRLLAGFEVPTLGEVYIDDAPMSQVPPHHRPTNMVFQNYAIFPHLNVQQNVGYGLRRERLSKEGLAQRVADALEMVKLSGFETRGANELSGGQRQRVALARALVKRPKVLLLDEPLGALDKKLREEMQLELRALQKSVGITFIFVTHDQEEALTMSDRIAVMSEGRVIQIASPRDLYERPNSVEVAGFIGKMNFVHGSVAVIDQQRAVIDSVGMGRLHLPLNDQHITRGMSLLVAIRPEKLHLSAERLENADYEVEGSVRDAAYLGDRSHYYVQVQGRNEPIAVAAQNIELGGTELRGGMPVWLSWSPDAMVLLPENQ